MTAIDFEPDLSAVRQAIERIVATPADGGRAGTATGNEAAAQAKEQGRAETERRQALMNRSDRLWAAAYVAVALLLLIVLALLPGGCGPRPGEPGQTTTRPVKYYVDQIEYWTAVADMIAETWADPASPMPDAVKKELAAARWWVRFFSEALALSAGDASPPPSTRALRPPAKSRTL